MTPPGESYYTISRLVVLFLAVTLLAAQDNYYDDLVSKKMRRFRTRPVERPVQRLFPN